MFKLTGALRHSTLIRSLWLFAERVYQTNETPTRSATLANSAHTTKTIVRVATVIFLLSFLLFAAYPTYIFVSHGKLTLFLTLFIPYVDPECFSGFALHITMQLIMAIYAAAGNMAFDLLMAMLINIYRDLVSVLEFQLMRLAELYAAGKPTRKGLLYRKAFLRNLLIQFNDMQEYI